MALKRVTNTPQDGLLNLLEENIHLPSDTQALLSSYKSAQPFPHLVIDGLFSDELLEPLIAEVAAMKSEQWQVIGNQGQQRVSRMRSGVELGTASQRLVNILHSAPFLYLLSELTDVWQLLPDPYLQGGGNAIMKPGDYFKIHADRNIAYNTGLTRRLALIVFLNKDWDSAFGGQLELWDDEATRCLKAIEPLFNRTVIFEINHPNYHGVPTPISCPPDRFRQSFLVYYHTVGKDGIENIKPHTSLFAPHFYRTPVSPLETAIKLITPPILIKAAKKFYGLIKPNKNSQ